MASTRARRTTWTAIALTAGLALAACGSSGDPDPADEVDAAEGGELTIAMGSLSPDLDPLQYNTPPNTFTKELFYDSLTTIDTSTDEVTVAPSLATEWSRLDELTWEFTLAPDVEFSDGTPVTAEAVASTAAFAIDPANNKGQTTRLATIEQVRAVDDATVRVRTLAPDPLLPARMSVLPVLPAGVLTADGQFDVYADPVGTGPWVVEEWVPGEELVVVPNERAFGEAPRLDRLTLTVIPEASSRVAALRSGDVDVVNKLPTDQMGSIEGDGDRIVSAVESGTYVVDLVAEDGPLADPAVRQALNHAVDKEALVEGIMGGLGEVNAAQFSNPGFTGHCGDIEPYAFDPDRARELLAEAGYADGFTVSLQTSNGYILNDSLLAQAIAGMLGDVGVDVDIEVMEYSNYLDAFYSPKTRADLFAWRASNNPFFDAELGGQFWLSDNTVHPTAYDNPEYDEVFNASRSELDEDRRTDLLCEASSILREDAPVIFGLHVPDIWAVSDGVASFDVGPDGIPLFTTAALAG